MERDTEVNPGEKPDHKEESNPGHMVGLLTTRYSDEAVPPSVWAPLDPYIDDRYIELIGTDHYVTTLNRWTKQIDHTLERLVEEHVKRAKMASEAVREGLRTVYQRGVVMTEQTNG